MGIKKPWLIFVLVIAAKSSFSSGASLFSVIGPKTAFKDEDYKFVIANNDRTEMRLEVTFAGVNTSVTTSGLQKEITMKAPHNCENNKCYLKVTTRGFNETTMIELVDKKYSVFIQTDKLKYKPGERINYRILALNADMKPAKFNSLKLYFSPKNNHQKEISLPLKHLKSGLYGDSFKPSDETYSGEWEFQVSIDNKRNIPRQTITVDNSRDSRFRVTVDPMKKILTKDELSILEFNIRATYFEGSGRMPVKGKVVASSASLHDHNNEFLRTLNNQTHDQESGKLNINLQPLKYPFNKCKNYCFINIVVKYKDLKGEMSQGSASIKIRENKLTYYEYETDGRYFTPGKSYKVTFYRKNFDETVDKRKKTVNAKLMRRYSTCINDQWKTTTKSHPIRLNFENGVAEYDLKDITENNDISMLFYINNGEDERPSRLKIYRVPSRSHEYLKIYLDIDELESVVKASVVTLGSAAKLFYLFNGRSGILASGELERSENQWTLPRVLVKAEMKPQCNLIIYYFQPNGEIVFNQKKIQFKSFSTYELSTSVSNQNPNPDEMLEITVKSKVNSFVGLMAVKESSNFFNDNDINNDRVNSEILQYVLGEDISKTQAAERSYNIFSESNSFIITNADAKTFSKCSVTSQARRVRSAIFEENNMENSEDNIERVKRSIPHDDEQPDTWLFENIEIDSTGQKTIERQVPDKISSYIMTAFSIDPEAGLSISKPVRINTGTNFHVEIHMPSVVFEKDTFKVELFIYNFKKKDTQVFMKLDNSLDEFNIFARKERSCNSENENRGTHSWESSKTLNPDATEIIHFYAQAVKSGDLVLKIRSSGDLGFSNYALSSKSVKVLSKDIERGETKAKFFDLRDHRFSSFYFPFDGQIQNALPGSTGVSGLVAGNIIGPSMDVKNLENTIEHGLSEKLSKYERAGEILKYMQTINSTRSEVMDSLMKRVKDGYFYILTTRKNNTADNGGFRQSENDQKASLEATAKVVKILNLVKPWNFGSNDNFIVDGLNFLKKKQSIEGSWNSDEMERNTINNKLDQDVFSTAYIVVALLENAPYKDRHTECIDKALEFIRKNSDTIEDQQTLAIAAYAMSFESFEDSLKLLEKLDKHSVRNNDYKLKGWNSSDFDIEIASHVILAYEKMNRAEKAKDALEFLLKKRSKDGKFSTIEKTNLGIKALSAMAKHLHTDKTSIRVNLDNGDENKKQHFDVSSPSCEKQFAFEGNEGVSAGLQGNGVAYIQCYQSYKVDRGEDKINNYHDITASFDEKESKLKVCVSSKIQINTKDNLIQVQIPSGYEFKEVENNNSVKAQRIDESTAKLSILTDKISKISICFKIEIIQRFEVDSIALLPVTVENVGGDSRRKSIAYYRMTSKIPE